MPIPSLPFGAIFNVLRFVITPSTKLSRRKNLQGYYLIYHQNSVLPINNSPEGIPNVLLMQIDFWKPDNVNIRAKDFDATYRKIWKTWEGTITMIDDKYGKGYYNYLENNEPGEHEIWCIEPGVIRVRVIDKGKANLRERRDNDPATQQWKKVATTDPLIDTYKKMLQ